MSDVIQALIVTHRVLRLKAEADGLLDTAMDFHLAPDFNNRVVLFFDRAICHTAIGYGEAAKAAYIRTSFATTA